MLSFFAKAREETSRSRTKDRPTGNIYHHHPSRRDVRALHKEMRRRQLLENKATSDDDDDGNDATEKESSPRNIGKKKMGRKKKYDRYNRRCKNEGCASWAVRGGFCIAHHHSATRERCSREGLLQQTPTGRTLHEAQWDVQEELVFATRVAPNRPFGGGTCKMHRAEVGRCSHEGCPGTVRVVGVCVTHGARRLRCRHTGCKDVSVTGGVCIRHGAVKERLQPQGLRQQCLKGASMYQARCGEERLQPQGMQP